MPRDTTLRSTFPRLSSLAAAPRDSRAMLTFDTSLAWSALLLLAIGLVMVYSSSIATAEAMAFTGYRPWYFLVRHAVFVAVGIVAAFVAFQIPLKAWQRLAPYLFIGGALLLIAVLIPGVGKSVNGAQALAVAVRDQPAAVGVHEAVRRALRGRATRCARRTSCTRNSR